MRFRFFIWLYVSVVHGLLNGITADLPKQKILFCYSISLKNGGFIMLSIDELISQKSQAFGNFPQASNKKNSDRRPEPPTGKLDVPGYPDCEAAWWLTPEGSGNQFEVFGSVYRVGSVGKSNKRKYLRTFPLANGGLFANILGTCSLLDHFANDQSISEADRNLYYQVSVDVTEALIKNLKPRASQRSQGKRTKLHSTPGSELVNDLLEGM